MKLLFSTLSQLFFIFNLNAQPTIEWAKSVGGSADESLKYADNMCSTQQTNDGGFVFAGYTSSNDGDVTDNHGSKDAWVVKFSHTGDLVWQRTYGGSEWDVAHCIRQTDDGGYIVGGTSHSVDGDVLDGHASGEFWIMKLSETGEIQWQSLLGGSDWDNLSSIQQTSDGGYIAIGTTMSIDGDVFGFNSYFNIWVVKLSKVGIIQWHKVLGGAHQDTGMDIVQTSDGGYVFASFTLSNNIFVFGNHGDGDAWIVKLSADGDIEWRKAYGGTEFESATSIIQTSDGGYVFVGTGSSTNGDLTENKGGGDFWIVKLTASGAIQWQKTYGGSGYECAFAIQETSDGGYIVGGGSESTDGDLTGSHGDFDYWLLKLNSQGALQWQKAMGGTQYDYIDDVWETTDGGFLVSGISSSNDGDVTDHYGVDNFDYWIVKLSAELIDVEEITTFEPLEIYPNPAQNTVFLQELAEGGDLQVRITNAQGQAFLQQTIPNGSSLDVSNLPNGVYSVIAVTDSGKKFSNKLSIVK
jgi:hypothetical protein